MGMTLFPEAFAASDSSKHYVIFVSSLLIDAAFYYFIFLGPSGLYRMTSFTSLKTPPPPTHSSSFLIIFLYFPLSLMEKLHYFVT